MSPFLLGIDLGTTSVKIVLVDATNDRIVFESSLESKAQVDLPDSLKNEQNVSQILSTVDNVLENFPPNLMAKVRYIGICGQMHGVVLWATTTKTPITTTTTTTTEEIGFSVPLSGVSNLITWQDSRCTPDFLSSLPSPDSHMGIHTGFGIPSIFWLQRNEPHRLEGFERAGTIHDFLVCALANNMKTSYMSPQNAASWGYFNSSEGAWNEEILQRENFPVALLPEIRDAGEIAGELYTDWHGIPRGCKIGVALGDLQASIYSTLHDKPEGESAFMNISTSVQLAFVLPPEFQPQQFQNQNHSNNPYSKLYKGVDFFPYFKGRYIAVAAALTGGNCLATFVTMLHNWMQDLGLEIDRGALWSKVLTAGALQKTTDLLVQPTLLGERSDPNKKGALNNAHPANLSLGHFSRAVCKGIIANIAQLMPQELLVQYGIKTIYGTGTALQRNDIFQEELNNIFDKMIIKICNGGDSAVGAAAVGKSLVYIF